MKVLQVKIDGEWEEVKNIENNPFYGKGIYFDLDGILTSINEIEDIRIIEEKIEYGNKRWCDNPCCLECALERKALKTKINKVDRSFNSFTEIQNKLDEIIDFINK